MRRAVIRRLRRWLYIGHRWIGIVTCLLFAMWFMSGLVMMYVAFPNLTDRERLAALPDIAWDKVHLPPDRAMAAAGVTRYPRDLRLNMLNDEPVYRLLDWDGRAADDLGGRRPRHRSHRARAGACGGATASRRHERAAGRHGRSRPMERHGAVRSAAAVVSDRARRCRRHGALRLLAQRRDRARHHAHRTRLELARLDSALDLSDGAAQGRRAVAAGGAVDLRHLHDRRGQRNLDRHSARAAAAALCRRQDHALSRLDGVAPRHRLLCRRVRADLDVQRLAVAQSRRILCRPRHVARDAAALRRP